MNPQNTSSTKPEEISVASDVVRHHLQFLNYVKFGPQATGGGSQSAMYAIRESLLARDQVCPTIARVRELFVEAVASGTRRWRGTDAYSDQQLAYVAERLDLSLLVIRRNVGGFLSVHSFHDIEVSTEPSSILLVYCDVARLHWSSLGSKTETPLSISRVVHRANFEAHAEDPKDMESTQDSLSHRSQISEQEEDGSRYGQDLETAGRTSSNDNAVITLGDESEADSEAEEDEGIAAHTTAENPHEKPQQVGNTTLLRQEPRSILVSPKRRRSVNDQDSNAKSDRTLAPSPTKKVRFAQQRQQDSRSMSPELTCSSNIRQTPHVEQPLSLERESKTISKQLQEPKTPSARSSASQSVSSGTDSSSTRAGPQSTIQHIDIVETPATSTSSPQRIGFFGNRTIEFVPARLFDTGYPDDNRTRPMFQGFTNGLEEMVQGFIKQTGEPVIIHLIPKQ